MKLLTLYVAVAVIVCAIAFEPPPIEPPPPEGGPPKAEEKGEAAAGGEKGKGKGGSWGKMKPSCWSGPKKDGEKKEEDAAAKEARKKKMQEIFVCKSVCTMKAMGQLTADNKVDVAKVKEQVGNKSAEEHKVALEKMVDDCGNDTTPAIFAQCTGNKIAELNCSAMPKFGGRGFGGSGGKFGRGVGGKFGGGAGGKLGGRGKGGEATTPATG